MSISSIQRKRKTEEFIQTLLKKGIEPNNFELNRMLTEYFDNNTLGMPSYKPIKQKPYEASNKADYNHNFFTLNEDLKTIYEANIEANNKAVAMQEYYDLEQNKVYNALSKLSLRVENVSESLKSTSKSKQYVQVFDDLYNVEFYGNSRRNIPYTTSFIDLLQKKVYTEKSSYKTNKILINSATINIGGLSMFDSYQTKGSLNNVLLDTIDDIFILSGKSSSSEGKSIKIDIDLGSLIEFNTVSFKFLSVRDTLCELYLSEDGDNYISVYDTNSKDYIEWNFNSKLARYIKIICHKPEPDGFNLNSDSTLNFYEYYFVLKNISIAKEEYETKSVFVSKVIDFDDLTSTIKLDATDMIFNNTRIDYFIGFDNEIDKIGWDAIENHKDHKLFMFEKRHKILNYHIDSFADEDEFLDLYKLFDLPKNVNQNSIKLTPAYNMWSVKQYNNKNNKSFSLATKDFSTHVAECDMIQLFMDCENYTDFKIRPNTLYVMTQFISLEQSMNLFNKFIKITDDNFKTDYELNPDKYKKDEDKEPQIRIFVNGYEVVAGDNQQYSFALRKGVNKIQIAIYYSSEDAVTNKRLYHNLNFKELTNDVFGFVPMKYTNSRTLDNMPSDSYQYYTIKNGSIYVKCNPDNMIKSEIEDMGYFLTYYCLKEDMIGYFEDNHIKFRIMAVLTSNDPNVSPELINFRITGR